MLTWELVLRTPLGEPSPLQLHHLLRVDQQLLSTLWAGLSLEKQGQQVGRQDTEGRRRQGEKRSVSLKTYRTISEGYERERTINL